MRRYPVTMDSNEASVPIGDLEARENIHAYLEEHYVHDAASAAAHNERPTDSDKLCWSTFRTYVVILMLCASVFLYMQWQLDVASISAGHVVLYGFRYFFLCLVGGIVSGFGHVLLTPIDLLKCRVQVGEYRSIREGLYRIYHKDSERSLRRVLPLLFRGWQPTLLGYCQQGGLKYGFYEVFKYALVSTTNSSGATQVLLFLVASSCAEFLADIVLAPWEAVKIKMQTTRLYPPVLSIVLPRMYSAEGMNAFYKGLPALWMRQVPYTMVKFASFESIVQWLYTSVLRKSKDQTPKAVQLLLTLVGGLMAGVLCGVISHPADTLVSKLNQRADSGAAQPGAMPTAATPSTGGGNAAISDAANDARVRSGASLSLLIRELGWSGLWRGLLPRLLMVGVLTALQWILYDAFKVSVGLPTTGGASQTTIPPRK